MKYEKPVVNLSYTAMSLIQGHPPGSKDSSTADGGVAPLDHVTINAYEADE